MSVQRQGGLQTQGVAGAQTGGTCAQLNQAVPQPRGVLAADVDLIAQRLAGIAGLGHPGGVSLQRDGAQGVFHGLGQLRAAGHRRQHLLALGALYRDGGPLIGDVLDLAVEALQRFVQVGQILVGVGGVHHQQIAVLLEEVQIGIVHRAAVVVGNDAVLGHVQIQCADVAGQHMLQKRLALRPGDAQAAHVGHVEQAAHLTGIQMLGNDTAGILDGHFPSAEVHQLRAGGYMGVIQLGTLQFAHLFFLLKCSVLSSIKGHKAAVCQLRAPVELPERFPFPQAERVAPSVVGCRRPAFSEYRPEPVLLPESFCVPLRRRLRRSLPIPSSDVSLFSCCAFNLAQGMFCVNRSFAPQEKFWFFRQKILTSLR